MATIEQTDKGRKREREGKIEGDGQMDRVGQLLHMRAHILILCKTHAHKKKGQMCYMFVFSSGSLVYFGSILCCELLGAYFVLCFPTQIVLYGLSKPLAYTMTTAARNRNRPEGSASKAVN